MLDNIYLENNISMGHKKSTNTQTLEKMKKDIYLDK